jgi:hypothetical protein
MHQCAQTKSTRRAARPGGFSMIGMLITLACIVVLMAISMTAINRAMTGEGSALRGTVRSTQDMMRLSALYQTMLADVDRFPQRRYIVPSMLDGSGDRSHDTTANLYSAMVMHNYVRPIDLIAANEFNGYVYAIANYDYEVYDPNRGVFWDPEFRADLMRGSNVSYAHMPLFGKRFENGWRATMSSTTVLLGNRGPENGIDNPASMTYGRNQQWGGHVVFGDGSIEFLHQFDHPRTSIEIDGERRADNLFAMETGAAGEDAILSFTREMTADGPVLQFD